MKTVRIGRQSGFVFTLVLAACGGGGSMSGPTGGDGADPGTSDAPGDVETRDDPGPPLDVVVGDWAFLDSYEASPGGFLAPCVTNEDCTSGFCVEGPEGPLCTKSCLNPGDCPPDFVCIGVVNTYPDIVFICLPKFGRICAPCKTDSQCAGGRCISLPDGRACSVPCREDGDCANPYRCRAVGEDDERFCLPPSGTCACRPADEGVKRFCEVTNAIGTCFGYETCDPAVGFVGCDARTPAPEACNGVDDDCDGVPDDGLPEGETCESTNEHGTCPGTRVCLGPKGWSCTAPVPSPEVCDGLDNDCDGLTDEDFKNDGQYASLEHCGGCFKSCLGIFPHATVGCDTSKEVPRCVVVSCDPGFIKLNDYQCIPAASTLCQPCAGDADCLIPDARCISLEDGKYCGQPCESAGDCPDGYECLPFEGGPDQCAPTTGTCQCTGENPDLSRACQVSWSDPTDPSVPVYTCHGIQHCLADGWGPCELPVETCDGQDQDCDGLTDEGFVDPVTGKYTGDENCGVCGNNCKAMPVAHGSGRCDASKTVPDCVVECDEDFFDVDGNPANGCECQYLGQTDFPGDVPSGCTVGDCSDANCDGMDGEVAGGVFVAKWGSDANPGTIESPLLTIQSGIERAAAAGKRDVYVATGVYTDPVTLRPGVSVYGGYSADFRVREPLSYETVVLGGPLSPAVRGAVQALSIQGHSPGSTTFAGFIVYAYNNRESGGNSIGVFVKDCDQSLRLWDLRVVGGDGGNGTPGAPGSAGQDGTGGAPGLAAYDIGQNNCTSAKENPGGAGGITTCGGVNTSGGEGGRAICPDYDEAGACNFNQTRKAPENGKPGQNNAPGQGTGGLAGLDALINPACNLIGCSLCTVPDGSMQGADGLPGTPGVSGPAGLPCLASSGGVVGDTWSPGVGGNGGNGGHGGGGGGGGAAGGVETVTCSSQASLYSDIGGSGGGGGSGGCGATGGEGGRSGGGSFAIFMVFTGQPPSLPTLSELVIVPGRGGDGGNGGNGGVGGKGGAGAPGGPDAQGPTATFCTSGGGHGGNGGSGGHGGGGGGGCGGPAYGLFVHGAPQALLETYKMASLTFLGTGQGGRGGLGGASLGNPGSPGQDGPAAAMNF